MLPLLAHQAVATAETLSHFRSGTNRLLVQAATGTGKTVFFTSMFHDPDLGSWMSELPKHARRMLVIAHRREIIQKTAETAMRQNPGLMVAIEQADQRASDYHDVVVASVQTLAIDGCKRLKRLMRLGHFGLVVVDEAHHAAAASYRNILAHLGFLPMTVCTDSGETEAATWDDVQQMERALLGWDKVAPKDRLLLGVTATPDRTDEIGLGCVFQAIASRYPIKTAVEDGVLSPILPWVIESKVTLDGVKSTAGDYNLKALEQAVNVQNRNALAITAWYEKAKDRPTIAFTVNVQHAEEFADEAVRSGIRAAAVSERTPPDQRRAILADYSAGRLDMIANCMILTEGVDLPLTSCILMLRPTQSAALYAQMVGRGLRKFAGKDHCVVIDVVDISRKHALNTAPVLYGLPPGLLVSGKDLREAEAEFREIVASQPNLDLAAALANGAITLATLKAKATTFNVWSIKPLPSGVSKVATLDWTVIGDREFVMSYPWMDGHETIRVQRDILGHFEVVATMRVEKTVRQRTVAGDVPSVVEAVIKAETFINTERRAATRLVGDAPWKKRPASIGQIYTLKRYRVPFDELRLAQPGGAGIASKLIDTAKATGRVPSPGRARRPAHNQIG